MTSGRRRAVLALLLTTALAASVSACGRFGGNDTNPRSDEKRESAPALAADAGAPAS